MNLIEKEHNIDKTISEFIKSDNEILKKKGIKLQEIRAAEKKGWTGLSLNELDYDVESLYNKLIEAIKSKTEIGKDELAIIALINSIRKDKIDLIKFMKNHELKIKEIEYKYEDREQDKKFSEVEL
ncbi:MAG: hypothetical protein PHU05_06095 [Bacilli bacterium]|nr:hypothetical protein [Bacilli bacterium]